METSATKKDRFKRLAAKRTNEIIKKLDILGHCGNKHSYEYDVEEVKRIFFAIEKKLVETKEKFKSANEEAFRF